MDENNNFSELSDSVKTQYLKDANAFANEGRYAMAERAANIAGDKVLTDYYGTMALQRGDTEVQTLRHIGASILK